MSRGEKLMTGAEVIIKQGNKCILGKVRHDGYDVDEFFKDAIFELAPDKIWPGYQQYRKDVGCYFEGEEIETHYEDGFPFDFESDIDVYKEPNRWFNTAMECAESLLRTEHDANEEGYICSYGDYRFIVDYDNKKIIDTSDELEIPAQRSSNLSPETPSTETKD